MEESRTIKNTGGKILLFGLDEFKENIVKGDSCFICGASPESKEFNNEHVIPDWVLRRFSLNDKFVTLPNNTKFRYNQYLIPCCKDCNTELGQFYEIPISALLSKPYEEVVSELEMDYEKFELLFRWLNLIFLKTHLKDKTILQNRDKRKGEGVIADKYFWEDLHHIHCIARAYYTKAKISSRAIGSFWILKAASNINPDNFDYVDNHTGKTVMVQIGEIYLIAVLDDAGAGFSLINNDLSRIDGELSPLQAKEIVAHLSYINLNLKERPIFSSQFSRSLDRYMISVQTPDDFELFEQHERVSSPQEILAFYSEVTLPDIPEREKVIQEVRDGKRQFLFDGEGRFIKN
ncbi:hypothetical protein [Nafulsella turpanensis]|uniref:hypothetical protein n=1 Tax=Nafulsella turpanensis TaxID=1265690 RepID=UPI000348C4A1|nr:hypothetical protein [Nafulsella turpanensis]